MDLKVERGEAHITHVPLGTTYRWIEFTIGPTEWTFIYGMPPLRLHFEFAAKYWHIGFDIYQWEKKDG